ncbi:transposase [Magnetococcales bacterium HHB-1]
MTGQWVAPKIRDAVVNFVESWSTRCEIPRKTLLTWIDLCPSQYQRWKKRRGVPNRHNAPIPKRHWLQDCEKERIIQFYKENYLNGYRRLSYMMLDENLVAVSPSSVYRVLKLAGILKDHSTGETKKGQGFKQPTEPHRHWHTDVSYINIKGTFYYLCAVLDGFSRFIVHWEIRESMKEEEIAIIMERYPGNSPRLISDNGPQFIAKEFKEFVRESGMTHVRVFRKKPV